MRCWKEGNWKKEITTYIESSLHTSQNGVIWPIIIKSLWRWTVTELIFHSTVILLRISGLDKVQPYEEWYYESMLGLSPQDMAYRSSVLHTTLLIPPVGSGASKTPGGVKSNCAEPGKMLVGI